MTTPSTLETTNPTDPAKETGILKYGLYLFCLNFVFIIGMSLYHFSQVKEEFTQSIKSEVIIIKSGMIIQGISDIAIKDIGVGSGISFLAYKNILQELVFSPINSQLKTSLESNKEIAKRHKEVERAILSDMDVNNADLIDWLVHLQLEANDDIRKHQLKMLSLAMPATPDLLGLVILMIESITAFISILMIGIGIGLDMYPDLSKKLSGEQV